MNGGVFQEVRVTLRRISESDLVEPYQLPEHMRSQQIASIAFSHSPKALRRRQLELACIIQQIADSRNHPGGPSSACRTATP